MSSSYFYYTEDRKANKIPAKFFPSCSWCIDPSTDGNDLLHVGYRRYEDAYNDEFYYFITRMIPRLGQNTKKKFMEFKTKLLLSDIFTVSDEAFALTILYNEQHVWEMQYKRKKNKNHANDSCGSPTMSTAKTRAPKGKKRFCDYKSGDRKGWSEEGMFFFNMLCRDIKKRREESMELERQMRERFLQESLKQEGQGVSGVRGATSEFVRNRELVPNHWDMVKDNDEIKVLYEPMKFEPV